MLCMWRGGFGLLVMHCWLLPRIVGQNIVRHPRLPVELGGTAELQEVSKNYFVIKHRDARTPEDTPRTEQHKQRDEIMAREKAAQQAQLWQHWYEEEGDAARSALVQAEGDAPALTALMDEYPDWAEPVNRLATLLYMQGVPYAPCRPFLRTNATTGTHHSVGGVALLYWLCCLCVLAGCS